MIDETVPKHPPFLESLQVHLQFTSLIGFLSGGRPKSRYLLFHIPIMLEKKVHFVDNGRFMKGYEKVVVRERNMTSDERRYWDAEVLAR